MSAVEKPARAWTAADAARFVVPAVVGALIFLLPVSGGQAIPFSLLTVAIVAAAKPGLDEALLLVLTLAAGGAVLNAAGLWKPKAGSVASIVFVAPLPWVLLRVVGFAVAFWVWADVGPEVLRQPETGVTVVNDIGLNVLVIYFAGLALMPLLTDYGLMEFVGGLARPAFRRLFGLPGRAAIDAMTSILSASAIGLLVTISQYRRGVYDAREASVIACSFSIVSIPFSLLTAEVSGIGHLFVSWYLCVLFASLVCAIVIARVPPLSRIPRTRAASAPVSLAEDPEGLGAAWQAALARARSAPGPGRYAVEYATNFLATAGGVLGPSMAVATAASVLLFHTPIIDWLVTPLRLLLELLAVPQAATLAPGFLVGFGDQFLPALVAGRLDSEYWRFVLAGLSVTQLIFMSEFGMLMLRSPLPVTFSMLMTLFVLRTLVTLPVLLLAALLFTGGG